MLSWNMHTTQRTGPKNPFQGAISFDNVGRAWTAIFLVISLEGWTEIMYYVQDAHSFWDWIYFVLLIVVSVSLSTTLLVSVCYLVSLVNPEVLLD